jgi:hypothetical protein
MITPSGSVVAAVSRLVIAPAHEIVGGCDAMGGNASESIAFARK